MRKASSLLERLETLIRFCMSEQMIKWLLNQILDSISKVSIDTLTEERIPIDLEKHLALERISLHCCKMSFF